MASLTAHLKIVRIYWSERRCYPFQEPVPCCPARNIFHIWTVGLAIQYKNQARGTPSRGAKHTGNPFEWARWWGSAAHGIDQGSAIMPETRGYGTIVHRLGMAGSGVCVIDFTSSSIPRPGGVRNMSPEPARPMVSPLASSLRTSTVDCRPRNEHFYSFPKFSLYVSWSAC